MLKYESRAATKRTQGIVKISLVFGMVVSSVKFAVRANKEGVSSFGILRVESSSFGIM